MLLKELANEYRDSAALMTARLEELKTAAADKNICEMERLRIRRRLDILKTMYYDTMRTAKYLESYYGEECE